MGDGMGDGLGTSWIAVLLVAFVVVAAIIALVRWAGPAERSRRSPVVRSSARQILDERYARGEIDPEEYQVRLRGLDDT